MHQIYRLTSYGKSQFVYASKLAPERPFPGCHDPPRKSATSIASLGEGEYNGHSHVHINNYTAWTQTDNVTTEEF